MGDLQNLSHDSPRSPKPLEGRARLSSLEDSLSVLFHFSHSFDYGETRL